MPCKGGVHVELLGVEFLAVLIIPSGVLCGVTLATVSLLHALSGEQGGDRRGGQGKVSFNQTNILPQ